MGFLEANSQGTNVSNRVAYTETKSCSLPLGPGVPKKAVTGDGGEEAEGQTIRIAVNVLGLPPMGFMQWRVTQF